MSRFQPCTTQHSLCTGTIDNTPAPQPTSAPGTYVFHTTPNMNTNNHLTSTTNPNNPNNNPMRLKSTLSQVGLKCSQRLFIDKVVKSNLPNKVKLWDPNSNTWKLHTFILQCKLKF